MRKQGSQNKQSDQDTKAIPENEKYDLVFISREIEHLKWIGKYIEAVLQYPEMTRRMRLHIYITIRDNTNSLSSFLFWRAMTLYNRNKEGKGKTRSSLTIHLGRPNFDALINDICVTNDVVKHYVYACGPNPMIKTLQRVCLKKSDAKENQIIFNYEVY